MAETVNVWEGGSTGWTDPGNWSLKVVPDGSMIAEIPAGKAVTVTDGEIATASAAQGVRLAASTSKLVLCAETTDATFNPWIRGEGALEKTGSKALKLTSCVKSFKDWDHYGDFYLQKGIFVRAGELWLPQDVATDYALGDVTVDAGSVFVVANDKPTYMRALVGGGTVSNPSPATAAVQLIQVGYQGGTTQARGDFSGKAVGRLRYTAAGQVNLTGVENGFTEFMVFDGNGTSTHGVTGIAKIGNSGELSSTGIGDAIESRTGGSILYLGTGETTSKTFWYRTQKNVATTWDAGANGGVVFTGKWYQFASDPQMGRLVLTGSNTVNACVLSNAIETVATKDGEQVTTYITKKGIGIWRFADGPARSKLLGGFGVDEGTLQFESIAETNVACSLGMATRLAEDYYGSWDPAKATDYAYRLGCETSQNAVFEFVGANSCKTTTRTIALGGDAHLRANGVNGATLSMAGVKALSAGSDLKILTLDGDATGENVLSEVSDGASRVGITKDGTGTWVLAGNQTFTGPLYVKGGTVKVRKSKKYNWYRFTVKDVAVAGGPYWMAELGFFDKDGNRCDLNPRLQFKNLGSDGNATDYPGSANLPEGEITYGFAGTYNDYNQNLNVLFDSAFGDGKNFRFNRRNVGNPSLENPSGWVSFVAHFHSTVPEVVAYDYVACSNVWGTAAQMPKSFSLEGSFDGEKWTMLSDVTNAPNHQAINRWVSDAEPYNASVSRKGKGFAVVGHDGDDLSVLEDVESVGVAQGAVLTAEAVEPISVDTLQVNVTEGVGTLANFQLAASGTLRVTAPTGLRVVTLPLDFSGVSGLNNAAGWDLEMNGRKNSGWSFKLTESGLTLQPPGFALIIK